MRYSVIVPTLGRTQRLRATLESLLACDPSPDGVIVVDGERSEATRAVVRELDESTSATSVVYSHSARGTTVQRNVGLAIADSDIVVFVDDDMNFRLTPDLFRHVERGFSESDVVGVTGHIVEDDLHERIGGRFSSIRRLLPGRIGTFTPFGYPRYLQDLSVEADIEYMPGGLMCALRAVAQDVGFDEKLVGYAIAEDEDFSYRLSRHGRIRFIPEIVLEHERYGERNLRAVNRALVMNRTYLFRKNFRQTLSAKLSFALLIGIFMAHRVINREWSGLRGLIEGVTDVVRGRIPELPAG